MNLKDLVLQEKTITFEFPGMEGFEVDLTFLAKEEVVKLTKEATKTVYEKRTRQPKEEFDSDTFIHLYSQRVIKDWRGLKLDYLKDLILIKPPEDPEAELEYSQDNAELLLKNSNTFDNWVSDMTGDLTNFSKSA